MRGIRVESYNQLMPAPIVGTKLYIPPSRPDIVPRPRLIHQINMGMTIGRKLMLISAPAGFGKTTLVGEWVASCGRPVAWLSLDGGDNNPVRFISYLVAALQTLKPGIGEGLVPILQSAQPLVIESVLTALLNDLVALSEHYILDEGKPMAELLKRAGKTSLHSLRSKPSIHNPQSKIQNLKSSIS